jgi:Tfp pilus assembly protein PilF
MKHALAPGVVLALLTGLLLTASPVPTAAQGSPDAESRFNAGIAHLREGRAKLALEEFKQAIKKDDKNPYFYKGLGLAYARLNKLKDAAKAFRKAIDLNPYYVDVHNDLGSVLMLQGKREAGKREFLSAYNDPMNPTPQLSARNLGRAQLEEGDYAGALNWFRTSISRDESYEEGHIGVSDAFVALGRPEDAIAQLELALEKTPDSPPLQVALGTLYLRAGRFSDARARLEQAAAQDPGGISGLRAAQLLRSFPK